MRRDVVIWKYAVQGMTTCCYGSMAVVWDVLLGCRCRWGGVWLCCAVDVLIF